MEPDRTATEHDTSTDTETTKDGTTTLIDHLAQIWKRIAVAQETRGGLDGVFSPVFMREYTQYDLFREFATESHWQLETEDDLDKVVTDALDLYVNETTKFSSWNEMRRCAAKDNLFDHYAGTAVNFRKE